MNLFNRETIAPSHVKCNRTVSSREDQAKMLADAMAGCKVKPTVVPGFAGVAPRPMRTSWVDPESRLKRKGITREERKQIRAMIDQMGVE